MKIKKIAILTSGGDAPGMNSAIYGVYTACEEKNISLLGFIGGYDGLIDNNFIKVDFPTPEFPENTFILFCNTLFNSSIPFPSFAMVLITSARFSRRASRLAIRWFASPWCR